MLAILAPCPGSLASLPVLPGASGEEGEEGEEGEASASSPGRFKRRDGRPVLTERPGGSSAGAQAKPPARTSSATAAWSDRGRDQHGIGDRLILPARMAEPVRPRRFMPKR